MNVATPQKFTSDISNKMLEVLTFHTIIYIKETVSVNIYEQILWLDLTWMDLMWTDLKHKSLSDINNKP